MRIPLPPKPWTPPADGARLLIVRLSALGDVIHALPLLPALGRHRPDLRVDWVVEDRAAALVEGREELDRVVVFPRRALRALRGRPWAYMRRVRAFLRDLRACDYDACLDLQGNLKSGTIARLSRARHRYGLARSVAKEGNHLFSTRRIAPPWVDDHRVERNLALLGGLLGHSVAWEDPGLPAEVRAAEEAGRLLAEAGAPASAFVVLHPGTSAFGAFKRWPPDRFGDLARTLASQGVSVVITAPPGEADLAKEVAVASNQAAHVVLVSGLDVLGEVLRRARSVVAGDTGPLHLAALAGTPVVGLFGPKDAAVYGPYGRRTDGSVGVLTTVSRDDVACRPCTLRQCADPVCMRGLAPDIVQRALQLA